MGAEECSNGQRKADEWGNILIIDHSFWTLHYSIVLNIANIIKHQQILFNISTLHWDSWAMEGISDLGVTNFEEARTIFLSISLWPISIFNFLIKAFYMMAYLWFLSDFLVGISISLDFWQFLESGLKAYLIISEGVFELLERTLTLIFSLLFSGVASRTLNSFLNNFLLIFF